MPIPFHITFPVMYSLIHISLLSESRAVTLDVRNIRHSDVGDFRQRFLVNPFLNEVP